MSEEYKINECIELFRSIHKRHKHSTFLWANANYEDNGDFIDLINPVDLTPPHEDREPSQISAVLAADKSPYVMLHVRISRGEVGINMPGFAARLNEELGAALVIANEFVANARSRNYSVQASDYISIDVENNSAEEMDLIIPDRVRVGSTVECTLPANASRESGNPIAIPIIGAGWF